MDIMATQHPITESKKHTEKQAQNSDLKCILGISIGMVIWAVLVLIATW